MGTYRDSIVRKIFFLTAVFLSVLLSAQSAHAGCFATEFGDYICDKTTPGQEPGGNYTPPQPPPAPMPCPVIPWEPIPGPGGGGGGDTGGGVENCGTAATFIAELDAKAKTKLYVAANGSDSNPGTQSAPFKTLAKASSVATAGTIVHVGPGSYKGDIRSLKSGTASARISFVSDTMWGAKIDSGTSKVAWDVRGSYIDIVGFDINGTNGQSWKNGIYLGGSYSSANYNHVHHLATGNGCTSGGGSAIGSDHYYGGIENDVIGNVVNDIGTTTCRFIQGIYISTTGRVINNLAYKVGAAAIHLWHDAHDVDIINNTTANSGFGIIVGSGDTYTWNGGATNVYVANNIVVNNEYGISEQGKIGKNTYANNLVYNNPKYNWRLLNGNTHPTDFIADPKLAADYKLQSGSPAIDKGTTKLAPANDREGGKRPQGAGIDIGAFEFGAEPAICTGGGGTTTPPPGGGGDGDTGGGGGGTVPPPGGSCNTPTAGTLHLYVSPSGSDSNPGTKAAPVKTIARADALAKPGYTIHVAPGTYNVSAPALGSNGILTTKSGTASARIKFVSDTKWGAKIVLSGTGLAWRSKGSYVDIDGFEITGTGRTGILIEGGRETVTNNFIHDLKVSGGCNGNGGAGINTYGTVGNAVIDSNIVRNIGYAMIGTCATVHGIYVSTQNNKISNNIVSGASGAGLHQWHGGTASTVVNNTTFHNKIGIIIGQGDGGATATGSANNYVANNIIYDNITYGILEYGTVGSNNRYVNNLVHSSGTAVKLQKGVASGTITANPLFVNYQANGSGNYHVQSTSPAVNKGTSSGTPTHDIDNGKRPQGGAVDIGAYESGAAPGSACTGGGGTTPAPTPAPAPGPAPTPAPAPAPGPAAAACTYYIAPTGSDSAAGTFASPWKTIIFGSAKLKPGQTLCARGGTYYGQAGNIWKSSGTASAPVTFQNAPGEKPVFDGQWGDTGTHGDFLVFTNNSNIVIDGITVQRFVDQYGNGAIDLHNGQGPVDNITIQNVTMIDNGSHTAQDHHIYLAAGATNVTIRNNLFIRAAGSAIQVYHTPVSNGIKIYNNVLIGGKLNCSQSKKYPCSASATQHWGMMFSDGRNMQVYNNTISGMGSGIEFNYGSGGPYGPTLLQNNLIVNSTSYGINVTSPYKSSVTSKNNGFFGNSSNSTINEPNAIVGNPMFVNAAGGDFHLNAGSPMIDKGTPVTLVKTDKDGVTRPSGLGFDIGAYEKK